jgi:methionyl-tRNA synthetase
MQVTANLSVAMLPFLPETANKIQRILQLDKHEWSDLGNINLMETGHEILPAEILFPKIEDTLVELEVQKLQQVQNDVPTEKTLTPQKETIQFDDFSKLDLRIGKIIAAEKIPKADKLLKLTVDVGIDQRTILSGIAEHFSPEEVTGKEVLVLINLAPRKMRGIDSEGMILMAEDEHGKLSFVQSTQENLIGASVR